MSGCFSSLKLISVSEEMKIYCISLFLRKAQPAPLLVHGHTHLHPAGMLAESLHTWRLSAECLGLLSGPGGVTAGEFETQQVTEDSWSVTHGRFDYGFLLKAAAGGRGRGLAGERAGIDQPAIRLPHIGLCAGAWPASPDSLTALSAGPVPARGAALIAGSILSCAPSMLALTQDLRIYGYQMPSPHRAAFAVSIERGRSLSA